jgi:Transcriptional regulator
MNAANKSFDFNILGESYPIPRIETESQTKENILVNATLLFAKKGYAAVSMREIADATGIKPASLYNHFTNKEILWQNVLWHAKELYLLYFAHLDETLASAETFEEVLEVIFTEPKRMANVFTCYAFSMTQAEQFRDRAAGDFFTSVCLEYSIDFLQSWLEKCIAKGLVKPFDAKAVAGIIMHSVLIGLSVKVQECMGRNAPYDYNLMFSQLQAFILNAVKKNR